MRNVKLHCLHKCFMEMMFECRQDYICACGNVRGSSCTRIIASLTDIDNAYTNVYSRFIKDVWIVRNILCPG